MSREYRFVGCVLQIFFPKKETAKYAGNWDPKETTLDLQTQKKILQNTF
jgi:hypothetical protein